jgi:hypothetical protein
MPDPDTRSRRRRPSSGARRRLRCRVLLRSNRCCPCRPRSCPRSNRVGRFRWARHRSQPHRIVTEGAGNMRTPPVGPPRPVRCTPSHWQRRCLQPPVRSRNPTRFSFSWVRLSPRFGSCDLALMPPCRALRTTRCGKKDAGRRIYGTHHRVRTTWQANSQTSGRQAWRSNPSAPSLIRPPQRSLVLLSEPLRQRRPLRLGGGRSEGRRSSATSGATPSPPQSSLDRGTRRGSPTDARRCPPPFPRRCKRPRGRPRCS